MDELNRLDRDRRSARITDEERRLIDEAVAAGRVTRVPTGASAFTRDYVWGPDSGRGMKLVQVNGDPNGKPGQVWRRQICEDGQLAGALDKHRSRKPPARQDK